MTDQEEYILWAYRLLLGREPESPNAVKWPETTREAIVREFIGSREFLNQHPSRAWVSEPDLWFIRELPNGTRFWLRTSDARITPDVVTGGYRPAETAFVRRHVRRGMNVVDVGANVGWFTVNMAMLVGPHGRVDAFEPREDIARYLFRTLAENHLANAVVHRCALASEYADGMIAYHEKDTDPAGTHLVLESAPQDSRTQTVPLRRLDSVVWGGVDFIRISVEGAERLVLNGAEIILSRDRPLILSDVDEALMQRTLRSSVPDLLAYFGEIGYEVRRILSNGRCGEPVLSPDISGATGSLAIACVPTERLADILSR